MSNSVKLRLWVIVVIAGLALALAGCGPTGPSSTPTAEPTTIAKPTQAAGGGGGDAAAPTGNPVGELPSATAGRIVFMGPVNDGMQVWIMNADGSGRRPITKEPGENAFASFSADGQMLAFTSSRGGNLELYVADANGENASQLTDNPAQDNLAVWSPDGSQVVFSSDRDGEQPDLYIANRADGKTTRLTTDPAADLSGSWSPDGKRIVFGSDRDGDSEIYSTAPDGGELTRLTDNQASDGAPAWSPDGKRIALHSDRDGNSEIYVMEADGSNAERLTNSAEDDLFPVWSPDGKWIAYTAQTGNSLEIHVLEVATRADATVPDVVGVATGWAAADEVLADVPLPTPPPVPPTATSPPMEGNEVTPEVLERAPLEGSPDAPVLLVEFSDYQCPFCKRFYDETLPQIRQTYIETGKVRLVFLDYPLPFHPQAPIAAHAAWCAGDQDAYWEMHDKLFAEESRWVENDQAESVLVTLADELGLDKDAFQTCVGEKPHEVDVQAGLVEGQRLAVSGTPTFFVNGRRLVGAQPFAAFRDLIEQELSRAK